MSLSDEETPFGKRLEIWKLRRMRKVSRLLSKLVWEEHKRHYVCPVPRWPWSKPRQGVYDPDCPFCKAFKPIDDEYMMKWYPVLR